jgi:uncharacterized circularly permuted ATP-grasp superfamily protein
MEAILQEKVATNYSPGIDFIGDKMFYTYVDDLVRYYLNSEPVIENIPTIRMDRADAFETTFDNGNFRNHVFKPADGRGGDGIHIGPKMDEAKLAEIRAEIMQNRGKYIAQKFTPLSRVGDRIVDMRLITEVGPNSIYVSRTPWGRGVPIDGDGKVNLSKSGREFTVLVVPDPKILPKVDCVKLGLTEGEKFL